MQLTNTLCKTFSNCLTKYRQIGLREIKMRFMEKFDFI